MKTGIFFLSSVLITLLFSSCIYSQVLKDKVLFDSNGNLYVVGQRNCSSDSDVVIIKYNTGGGAVVWQRKLGLQGTSYFKAAILANSNIFITAGNSTGSNKRIVIAKCDLNGNISTAIFSRTGGSYGNAITADNSGSNIYIAGRTDQPVGNPKFLIMKYNSNLDSQWTYTYTGSLAGNFDEALAVKTHQSGDVILTGYASQGQSLTNTYDYLTLRLSNSGTLQWAKRFNGAANREDRGIAVEVDGSGNSYVTGYSYLAAGSQLFTIKYNSNGDSVTSAGYSCINANTLNQPVTMTSDGTGNLFITGFGQCSNSNNNYDYLTLKYNSSLVPQWSSPSLFIGSGNCYPSSIAYINSHVYVTGESDSSNGNIKFLTLKYDAGTGSQLWQWIFNTSVSNYAKSVGTDASENVFVAGYSLPDSIVTAKYTGWSANFWTCQPFGIQVISSSVPKTYSLYQNYPNPFNPSTKIEFAVPVAGDGRDRSVKLIIYDALGREAELLVNQELHPGTYAAEWNASNFPSGVYFYSLQTSEFTQTRKMILIK